MRAPISARISAEALPLLPGAIGHMQAGLIPGGAYRNRTAYAPQFPDGNVHPLEMLLYDPQTSGGLLVAIGANCEAKFQRELALRDIQASCIGHFDQSGLIRVC